MAVSAALRRLVVSNASANTLTVFETLTDGTVVEPPLRELGGGGDDPNAQFMFFSNDGWGGWLCFTEGHSPLLVVPDPGHNCVHLLNVTTSGGVHAGFLCPPGEIKGPRAAAASASHIAISAYEVRHSGVSAVHLFDAVSKAHTRQIGCGLGFDNGGLNGPYGVRLTPDGQHVVVVDRDNNRVSKFRVVDGAFVGLVVPAVRWAVDAESSPLGWLVTDHGGDSLELYPDQVVEPSDGPSARPLLPVCSFRVAPSGVGSAASALAGPSALAFVPGTGLYVRDNNHVTLLRGL